MKPIIIVKPKSISSKDKSKLTKEGNIVIESESKDNVTILKNNPPLLFELCIVCAERIWMSEEKRDVLRIHHVPYFCINGHSQAFV